MVKITQYEVRPESSRTQIKLFVLIARVTRPNRGCNHQLFSCLIKISSDLDFGQDE